MFFKKLANYVCGYTGWTQKKNNMYNLLMCYVKLCNINFLLKINPIYYKKYVRYRYIENNFLIFIRKQ